MDVVKPQIWVSKRQSGKKDYGGKHSAQKAVELRKLP